MAKFIFGNSDYDDKMIINAECLDDAKREFSFQCGDVSKFTYKGNWEVFKDIQQEPYGFTDGKPNEEFNKPNFYQRIKIREEIPHPEHQGHKIWEQVGEITVQEIELILATPDHLLLANKSGETDPNPVAPSKGIMMLRQQSRAIQLQFRNKQLELIQMKSQSALQLQDYNQNKRHIENEQKKIQEKIDILQTYSGIGKDLVKVHSGKPSKAKEITVFQAFRYMKEDIELLTDFEEFNHETLDAFDEFLAKNYKELIPVDLSIQAFKISKFPILYKRETMFGTSYSDEKEDKKIFIIIRNGDNVYRMFNNYKLNGKLFHSEDEMEGAIKSLGAFKPSVLDAMEHQPDSFWEIQGETESELGKNYIATRTKKIPASSPFYPELDSLILETEFNRCIAKFEAEIERRIKYIEENNLQDILTVQSWRWGKFLGRFKLELLEPYYKLFYRMYIKEAFRTKDYVSSGALGMISSAYEKKFVVPARDNTQEYDNQNLLYDYPSSYNKDVPSFNPLSGASFNAYVIRADNHFLQHGFYEEARQNFMQKVWEETDKMHMANFHSVAILQNILDNRKIFSDHEVDFITGDGMENIRRVYDAENMIQSQESKDRIQPDELLNKILKDTYAMAVVGQPAFLLYNYEIRIEYSGSRWERNRSYKHYFDTTYGDKPFRHKPIVISYCHKKSITAEGMISTHGASNYNKGIWAGDPKMGKITIAIDKAKHGNEKLIVTKDAIVANIPAMKEMMRRREFREEHYPTYGVIFKYLLKLAKEDKNG